MQGIVEILRDDIPLVYHISGLLHNEEWRNALKACLEKDVGAASSASASGDKPDEKTSWKLRASLKKFEHLNRHDICEPNITWC